MRSVSPEVFLVAETRVVYNGLDKYLNKIGAVGWSSDADNDADFLTEFAGRLCYRSFKPGMNANVTKIRDGNGDYLSNILKQKHGSVFEHASVSFVFHNVSRVFTHELVRHRVGVAISQESMRYVRLTDIPFWTPGALEADKEVTERGAALLRAMEDFQRYMAEKFKLDDPGSTFTFKKAITSAMRRFAPDGVATSILWTVNMRALRHVLELRTALGAEEEIRLVFDKVGEIVIERYPNVFQDFLRTKNGEWKPNLGGSDG